MQIGPKMDEKGACACIAHITIYFSRYLDIPDICHGRHGHVRVNFFWPV